MLAQGAAARAADDIVLGMSAAFTGPSRELGIELYRGSAAYFEHVNRTGGVHGRPLVIRALDDGYNPDPAIANTIRFAEDDRTFLLLNYVGTPTVTQTLPLLKHYQDRSLLLFFPFTGAQPQRVPPYNAFAVNLRASYYKETEGLVDHFVAQGRRRIALFYQIDAYGRTGWEGVRQALAKHRLTIAGEATYRRGTPFTASMSDQVALLRQAKPDAVICVGAYAACAAFIRDARAAGWEVPIANLSFVGSESMLELLLEAEQANGRSYTSNLINSQVVPSYHDLNLPAVREYRELVRQYRPGPPAHVPAADYRHQEYCFVGLEGFLNAKLLAAILRGMKPPLRRQDLPAAVQAVRDLDLGIGIPVSYRADKGLELDRVYFTQVLEGRFVPLDDWTKWRQ